MTAKRVCSMYSDPEKSSQMVKLLKTKNKENAGVGDCVQCCVCCVQHACCAWCPYILLCSQPSTESIHHLLLSLLSAIRPSIHPSIYIQHIRTYKSHTRIRQPAREPDGPARLKSFLPCSLLAGVPHRTSVFQSFSLFYPLSSFSPISLPSRCTQQKV